MYEIKLAREDDIPDLINFFRKVYRPGHIIGEKEYLDWQYLNAPGNILYSNYPNLILKKGDDIVGHLGLIPYKFNFFGKPKNGAFLASLIVNKDLRSHGAGVMLVREAEKYFDILYTTGFSPSSEPVFKLCGWQEARDMTRCIHSCGKGDQFSDDGNVVLISRFGKEWDDFWQKFKKNYNVTTDRSSAYLNWRFCDNPKIKYHIFGRDSGGIGGYIVLRIENGNDFTGCRIVDLVADDKNLGSLLKFAVIFAASQKADFADFFSFPEIYDEGLLETGFYRYNPNINNDPPIFILPTDRKKLTLNFSYKIIGEQDKISPSDWFVVKSDGDRDRAY